MTKTHKASIEAPFLLRRKLFVEGLDESQWDDFLYDLNHHPCIDFAERKSGSYLCVSYDGSHWTIDELLALITSRGGSLKPGWWTRRKLAWYRFTDDNVRANARHEPHCCSKIPPMKRK